ncbi:zinc finger protein 37-like [Liolophura sinensis]|uniref:zinc finger protein 37-like n=1 Tax=Liolophura sinensis TaxID=3198878 RepID=UPI003158D810
MTTEGRAPHNQPGRTEDLKTVIEIFDTVTAIVSQPFLNLFNFADHDACKKLLLEVSEASSVELCSSPGTNPNHPAFSLTGSLSSLLKTESFLFEKFQELNQVGRAEASVVSANGLQVLAEVTEETLNAPRVMSEPLESSVLPTRVYQLSDAACAELKSSSGESTQVDQDSGITTAILNQSYQGKRPARPESKDLVAISQTLSSNKESKSSKQASSNVSECKISPENRKYETLCALLGFGKPQNKLVHEEHGAAALRAKATESKAEACHEIEGELKIERVTAKHPNVVPSIISKVHSVLEKCRGEKRKRNSNVIVADSERKRSLRIKQRASGSSTNVKTCGAQTQRVTLSAQKYVQKRTLNKRNHTDDRSEAPRRSLRNKRSGAAVENTQPTSTRKSVKQTNAEPASTRNKDSFSNSECETSAHQEPEVQDHQLRIDSAFKLSTGSVKSQTDAHTSEASQVECRPENEEENRPEKGMKGMWSSEAAETSGLSVTSAVVSGNDDLLKVPVETRAADEEVVAPGLSDLRQPESSVEESSSQNVENANSVTDSLEDLSNKRPIHTGQIKGNKSDSNNQKLAALTNAFHYSNPVLREIDMFREDNGIELLQIVESNNKTVITKQSGHCAICGQEFESCQSFAAHIMYSHFKFKCQKCLSVFSKREALEDHVRGENICQGPRLKSRRRKRSDARSESTPSKRKDLRCGDCDQVFGHRSRLDKHQLEAHNPIVVCSVCNETFQSFARLRVHIDLIHTEQEHICDVCGKSFKALANMVGHRKRHNAERRFVCGNCGKAFKDKCAWKEHLETHKPKEERTCRFICPTCGKRFQSKRVCLDHQNIHTGTRPYECELCRLRFASLGIMKSHMKMKHSDNRPYRCDLCPKAFKEKRALQAHTVTHTGISEHKCLHCGRPFGTATICKTHMLKCKKSKGVTPMPGTFEPTKSFETSETSVVDTSAVEVHLGVEESQSAVETMEMTFDDQQITELQVTTEVVEDPVVFMCSACNETFDNMESAATHISLCQVEGKEENALS